MRHTFVSCAGLSLVALFAATPAGYGQEACRDIDLAPPAEAMAEAPTVSAEALEAALAVARGPGGRIVGGVQTLISDNPWQVALIRASVPEPTRSQFCGGSIIGDDWILTAAHCVRNSIVREDPTRVDIVAGSSQYAVGGERLKVSAIHTHPDFNENTMDNDFALLQLQSATTMGQAIQLIDAKTDPADGTEGCVSGWGATAEGAAGSIDLLGAMVPIVSNTVCNEPDSYDGDILASMLCAGKAGGGVDSCQGDSGGPFSAVINSKNTLVGVVSWGEGCARRLKYGVYARVSTAADWIRTTTGN